MEVPHADMRREEREQRSRRAQHTGSKSFGMAGSGPGTAVDAGLGRGLGRHAEQGGHAVASGQPAEIKQVNDEIISY